MVRQYHLGTPQWGEEHGVMGAPNGAGTRAASTEVSSLGVGRWKQLEPEEN